MALDWISFGSAITGAVVGGLMSGYFALRGAEKNYRNQLKQNKENEEKLIQGLLQAIHDEIETVFDRYQETMGSRIESLKDGEPLLVYYPLVSDFFTIYNGNSFLIGRIPDNDLRKQIVKTYTFAKGMIDSYRMNNEMVQKFEYWHQIFQESKNEVHQQNATAHYRALVEYAKSLKLSHKQAKSEGATLIRSLRKQGVLSEKRS
jgi:hypothetical protein